MSAQDPTIDDMIKALPLAEKVPVLALKNLLDQREKIDEEEEKEILAINQKYQQLIKPLLQRVTHVLNQASEIIRGAPIKPQEVAGAKDCMKPNEKIEDYLKGKVIDNYWMGVFSNSALVDDINE